MITYSLFHLWVLGNSNPYYPAKSITHQPLEVTNKQKEKKKASTTTINMRKTIPWVLAALVDQEVPIEKGNKKPSHLKALYKPLKRKTHTTMLQL